MIKKFSEYFESSSYIDEAEELTGLVLSDDNIIPELRNFIELKLEEGDDELADKLTSLKKEIEKSVNIKKINNYEN